MTKPIYERKIWGVLKKAAKELGLALDHIVTVQGKAHINAAIKILDDHVLEDMKAARKCQRGENGKI